DRGRRRGPLGCEVGEGVVEGVEGCLWRDGEGDDLLGVGLPDLDAGAVVVWAPEEGDVDAAAGSAGELAAAGDPLRDVSDHVGSFVCEVPAEPSVSAVPALGSGWAQAAIVKVSRTMFEMGFSVPVIRAGAVPSTA